MDREEIEARTLRTFGLDVGTELLAKFADRVETLARLLKANENLQRQIGGTSPKPTKPRQGVSASPAEVEGWVRGQLNSGRVVMKQTWEDEDGEKRTCLFVTSLVMAKHFINRPGYELVDLVGRRR